jgi:hypothetical protein
MSLHIAFRKISDERHVLEIARDDDSREQVECETRSYLLHDFLHYAVESEAGIDYGFWGNLARGKTLDDMNDRSGAAMIAERAEMGAVEQVVGALHGATKGISAAELVSGMRRFAEALQTTMPDWLTTEFVVAVQERLRRLVGHWKATPYGGRMELAWPVEKLRDGAT